MAGAGPRGEGTVGPVARLFGSLANTLLDLGLPRIRAWVRERVGEGADVERVSTEGKLIHLDGVRLPIGPRGELVLERATAIITPARGIAAALPEVRLHAFRGVLSFTGPDSLHAAVTFVAAPDADEAAWVAGELTIHRATWSMQNARTLAAAPPPSPMEGRARLVVTSTSWSLDDGSLTSEQASASVRFTGRGRTEAGEGAAAGGAIDLATLALDGARVGPFVDAVQAMLGRPLAVPPGVPLDARLEGTLSWGATTGGRCTLHVTAEGLDARLTGEVGPDGRGLAARLSGDLAPAVPMRGAGVRATLLPRSEDRIAFVVEATGEATRPDIQATFRAQELGFRFGKPRFQPALVARAVEAAVELQAGGPANVRASARLGAGTLAVEGALATTADGARSLAVSAVDLEPSWVVAVACALSQSAQVRIEEDLAPPPGAFAVPRDARVAAALVVALGATTSITGGVTMTTPRGRLALEPLAIRGLDFEGTRLRGRLAITDALRMNLFPSDVRPAPHGALDVDLAVSGVAPALALRGTLAAPELRLAVASRPDVPPFLVQDVSALLDLDATALVLRELRFVGYGGVFTGMSTILLGPAGPAPAAALVLACHDAHASFVEALATLAGGTPKVRVERDGHRPEDELWIPRATRISATATLGADLLLTSTFTLTVPGAAPSSLTVRFVLTPELRIDGSNVRGTLAIADALTAGAFGGALRPLPGGDARIEATLHGPIDDPRLEGFVTAAELRLALHEGGRRAPASPVFVFTELATLFRLDAAKLVWHRLAARAYGGSIGSAGVVGHGSAFVGLEATLAARGVSLGDLPIDDTGRTLAELARGRLGLDLRIHQGSGTTVPAAALAGRGALWLDEAAFPLLARSKPALAKYGLAPPAENAIAPATCTIFLHERGWSFCDARAVVPGCEANGRVDVGSDGALDGGLVVTLGHELLASSAVTMLPSLLAEHLTVPVRITGNVARPHIDADLAACFGNLFTDNRVSALLSEAASDVASLFTGSDAPRPPPAPAPPPARPLEADPHGAGARGDAAEEDALIRDLVTLGAHWDEIDARIEAHRRRFVRQRIG